MSLPNYLAKIKSAGVYRYVFDKSDIPEPVRDSIRLVVGYSEKGPFNTPVYIEDSTDFIRTFGNISRRMERKGIFFHRNALQCLQAGPIVCLNLKPFNVVQGQEEKANIYAFNASDVKLDAEFTAIVPGLTDSNNNKSYILPGGQYDFTGVTTINLLGGAMVSDADASQSGSQPAPAPSTASVIDIIITPDEPGDDTGDDTGSDSPARPTITPANKIGFVDGLQQGSFIVDGRVLPDTLSSNDEAEDVINEVIDWSAVATQLFHDDEQAQAKADALKTMMIANLGNVSFAPGTMLHATNPSQSASIKHKLAVDGVFETGADGKPVVHDGATVTLPVSSGSNGTSPKAGTSIEFKPGTTLTIVAWGEAALVSGGTPVTVVPEKSFNYTWVANESSNEGSSSDSGANEVLKSPSLSKSDPDLLEYDPEQTDTVSTQVMHPVTANAMICEPQNGQHNLVSIYDTNRFWKVDAERIHDITVVSGSDSQPLAENSEKDYMRIVHTGAEEDSCTVFIRPYVPSNWNVKISDWYASEVMDDMPPYLEPIRDHYLSEFFVEIYVFKGNLTRQNLYDDTGTLGSWIYTIGPDGKQQAEWQPFCIVDEGGKLHSNPYFKNAYGELDDALDAMADVTTSGFVNRYVGICFPSFRDGAGNFIDIASVFNRDHQEHKMLLGMNEAILDIAYDYDLNGDEEFGDGESKPEVHGQGVSTVSSFIHSLCSPIVEGDHDLQSMDEEVRFDPAGKAIEGLYIKGYKYNSISRADKDEVLQTKVLNVLAYKGIFEALTNNIDIDYKYIIDTFQTYPTVAMKAQLSTIAKKKFNCLALLNFPPMRKILDYCGWKNYQGGFDMKAILKKGGITLPSEIQGASWAAFYTQLQMTDGAVKFIVPSAALVSNLYMTKRALRLPYYIVAGPNYGRIDQSDVVGPDYNYARADLDILEPFGVNAIIHIPRKGIVINGNQTAKQTPQTSLSKIHVRELVTFLQDELENMLLNYQWELNTATLRDMVRSKAEVILGLCKANGGIYDYKITCDDTNNTLEVINNSMLVIDVDIIAAKGTEKIVQTLTLHRIGTDLTTV